MPLTDRQSQLLASIESAVAVQGERRIRYQSEWLGYLPFGAYQWIECQSVDLGDRLPNDWQLEDLQALATVGRLELEQDWQDPQDEFRRIVSYRVTD